MNAPLLIYNLGYSKLQRVSFKLLINIPTSRACLAYNIQCKAGQYVIYRLEKNPESLAKQMRPLSPLKHQLNVCQETGCITQKHKARLVLRLAFPLPL